MKRITFSLVSVGYKILSVLLLSIFICLTAVLFYYRVAWYAIVFSCVVMLLCLLAVLLCFSNKIVLDLSNRLLKVYSLKKYKINLDELERVTVDLTNSVDKNKYCFIVFNLHGGKDIKISGYSTLLRNKAVFYTQREIDRLNANIRLLQK